MATLFFEGFERGYIYNKLDSNWTQEPSQATAANPLYSFGGYTSFSGVSGEYCWQKAADNYLSDDPTDSWGNPGAFAIQPAKADKMWQYATSQYPTQLMTGITCGETSSPGCFDGTYNYYPNLGTPPGFLSLTNIDGRDIFNYSEIDSINLTGMKPVTEGAEAVYLGCRWLGLETKHPDFIARDKEGRYGDKHPLVAFTSGNQELLFSLVNISGTGWFQDRKIDGGRTAATMGLRVEQNGVLKGVFDMNISGINGVNDYQIQTVADITGSKNMDVQTGKILAVQNIKLGPGGSFPGGLFGQNYFSTMSRWTFLNIEIRYEPTPYVSLQIEGVDCIAIPLDDPTVNLNNRSDPNIDYVVPIDAAHFDQIRFFNRTYDSQAKNVMRLDEYPPDFFFECSPIDNPVLRYPSYYVIEGKVLLLDDICLIDSSTEIGPSNRVGPDAHVTRLFPGLVAFHENNRVNFYEPDRLGLGDDYMYLDGKSEWTAEYEAVDEAAAFTGYNSVTNRTISAGTMVGTPDKPQKRAAVKDADCIKSYIHAFKEGQIQTMPFLPLDYIEEDTYYPIIEQHKVYNPANSTDSNACSVRPFFDEDEVDIPDTYYSDGFETVIWYQPGDPNSAFRYYLSSGIAGIKVYNEYFPRNLNSSFENVFWGPESENWPDVDLKNIETHLIWYDKEDNTTNVFDTGQRINSTFYPDDRMAWVTGLGYNVQGDASQVREFYDFWGNGRGINLTDTYVLPYMANLAPIQYNIVRYGDGSPNTTIAGSNNLTWRASGVQSGMPWAISAWVYFKEEDDIIHLYSRYLDNEIGVSGVVDFQRNYIGTNVNYDPADGEKFPEFIFEDCTPPVSFCYSPPEWNPNDYYSVIDTFHYNFTPPEGPSNWPTGLGAWWPFALYATRSGIRLATIGAETNEFYHRMGANPAFNPESYLSQDDAEINTYNVPTTWQWSGSLQDPLIYRDFFFSGEIPVNQWCHIEINKDSDRYVRVFCSGIPSTGHQVVVKSHPQDHYRGLSEQMLGEEVTGPTPDLYQFNKSGLFWRYYGEGNDRPPLAEIVPTDIGPMFNSCIAILGNVYGTENHPCIIVPPRIGPNVQIEDYIYVTGQVLHTGAFPVPDKWVPIIDDFYNSCQVQMTGDTQCNSKNYYLYHDPISNEIWDSGLFIEQSGFRFGVRKT